MVKSLHKAKFHKISKIICLYLFINLVKINNGSIDIKFNGIFEKFICSIFQNWKLFAKKINLISKTTQIQIVT